MCWNIWKYALEIVSSNNSSIEAVMLIFLWLSSAPEFNDLVLSRQSYQVVATRSTFKYNLI